jgi:hypothetical protein
LFAGQKWVMVHGVEFIILEVYNNSAADTKMWLSEVFFCSLQHLACHYALLNENGNMFLLGCQQN